MIPSATPGGRTKITLLAASLILVVAMVAGCVIAPRPNENGSAAVSGTSMEAVVSRTFTAYGFELEDFLASLDR